MSVNRSDAHSCGLCNVDKVCALEGDDCYLFERRLSVENTRGGIRDGSRAPPRGAGPNWGSGPGDDARGARVRREAAPVLEKDSGGAPNPMPGGRRTTALARRAAVLLPARGTSPESA